MMNQPSTATQAERRHNKPQKPKAWTSVELSDKAVAETYLTLALTYRSREDTLNALSCCIEGLKRTFLIPRPLAVRDQLEDLRRLLDADGDLTRSLRTQQSRLDWHSLAATLIAPTAPSGATHLERLVSIHQLISYPSEYPWFNRAYDEALVAVKRSRFLNELYVVRCTAPGVLACPDDLHYCVVAATSISDDGPYYLDDICAVVRK